MISIHAPREGSDTFFWRKRRQFQRFQSTLPVRGATHRLHVDGIGLQISIHAPREGSDHSGDGPNQGQSDFNPRSP